MCTLERILVTPFLNVVRIIDLAAPFRARRGLGRHVSRSLHCVGLESSSWLSSSSLSVGLGGWKKEGKEARQGSFAGTSGKQDDDDDEDDWRSGKLLQKSLFTNNLRICVYIG